MNPENYVSYPVALALKKAGFDEPCRYYYNPKGMLRKAKDNALSPEVLNNRYLDEIADGVCSAVSLWQAQKWLREVHSLHVDISTHGKNYWTTSITGFNDEDIPVGYLHPVNAQAFDNYESALSAGIAAALELIEKKGE